MTEEHEMKLRILQKKEILVDLQIALAREELDQCVNNFFSVVNYRILFYISGGLLTL